MPQVIAERERDWRRGSQARVDHTGGELNGSGPIPERASSHRTKHLPLLMHFHLRRKATGDFHSPGVIFVAWSVLRLESSSGRNGRLRSIRWASTHYLDRVCSH
jgi:hypothetical protein